MEETSAINRRLSVVTLISSPLSPYDDSSLPNLCSQLIVEILVRLPVKFLLRFRCVCKSWNSLITNPEFAKIHLRFSKTNRSSLVLNSIISLSDKEKTLGKFLLKSYPIKSPFTTKNNATQFRYPPKCYDWESPLDGISHRRIWSSSCDGIICLKGLSNVKEDVLILWNPFIGKSRELPPLANFSKYNRIISFGLGYDYLSDNYKVVAVHYLPYRNDNTPMGSEIPDHRVMVHKLGTNFWRKIRKFPYCPHFGSPTFFRGKLHWLTIIDYYDPWRKMLSLDLGNETYQEVLLPNYDYGKDVNYSEICVLNDCLSIFFPSHGVWVMKEYGNRESWTKILSFPNLEAYQFIFQRAICIFEDDQVLLQSVGIEDLKLKYVVYHPKNGIVSFHTMDPPPELMVESLISP